ncbi:hypothetical protein DFH09DRAFT_323496 [Mycena vulgaris]|nr:hypothetical protein DFH09DRAFT_323496 [Mycena vulgaris]
MSLRTGLVRAARLAHISQPRLPPRLFVRASHDAYTSTRLEHFLLPLRYPDEPNAVRRHYLPLVAELERLKAEPEAQPLPQLLTREELITIIDLLATSGRPPDLECIRSMFSHLPMYFGIAVTPDLHTVVITALARQGYLALAQEWISQIPALPPYVTPTLEHYHTFLKGCPHHVHLTFLREVVTHRMRRDGVRPDNETFSILVRSIVRNATEAKIMLTPETFGTIIADMKMLRLAADPSILSMITEFYLEHGFQVYAEDIRKIYAGHFPDVLAPEEEQRAAWNKQLAAASQTSGIDHSLAVFRRLKAEGCTASPDTLRAILSSSKSIEDLWRVQEVLGVRADASEYAVLVNNSVRIKKPQDALAVYEQAKKSGIVPVAGLVGPIIRALCASDIKAPLQHNLNLDNALALYADLDDAFPAPAPDSPEAAASNNHSEHSKGPDMDIYTSLLRGLSQSSNIKTAYPIAQALFVDMKARGVTRTTALKISNVVLEIRICETLDEAFNTYRKRRGDLTEYGYLTVLHAFSRMSLAMGHPDSLEYYFQIVADMRLAGFRMSSRVYTDILQQFAEFAAIRQREWRRSKEYNRDPTSPMPPTVFGDLDAAVRQVHNLLSLDPEIQPEKGVWNQLMDTYQRIGRFPEAYRVWETLYFSGKYGPIGVSIIFDACGFAGEYEIAKMIANKLLADNFVFNLHNWNSYIECLCRLNQVSDALKVLCMDMGSLAQPVKPELATLAILLKFSESKIQTNIILQRVRHRLPDLWASYEAHKEKETLLRDTKEPP